MGELRIRMKTAIISVIGKTNVGKSTLVNALVGTKVAIVSPKPQTTRENILGILNEENKQIVFIDTPGIHRSKNSLDSHMNKSVRTAKEGVDLIVYMIDATDKNKNDEILAVQKLAKGEVPVLALVSKTDLVNFEKLYPFLSKINEVEGLVDIIPISTHKRRNLDVLLQKMDAFLQEGEPMFEEYEVTDKPLTFHIAEVIRETMLYLLNEEIPHGVAVVVTKLEEGKTTKIDAEIVCEKDSHKPIIIGKNGEKLKKIGEKSRFLLEKQLKTKIMLSLFVKIIPDWRSKPNEIKRLGISDYS